MSYTHDIYVLKTHVIFQAGRDLLKLTYSILQLQGPFLTLIERVKPTYIYI